MLGTQAEKGNCTVWRFSLFICECAINGFPNSLKSRHIWVLTFLGLAAPSREAGLRSGTIKALEILERLAVPLL